MNETDTTFSFLLVASHLMREQIKATVIMYYFLSVIH